MNLEKGTTIVIVDGEKLNLFDVVDIGSPPELAARAAPDLSGDNKSSGTRHSSSAANPDDSRLEEDSHVVAVVDWLNNQVLGGKIASLVVIAPPKSLGEMRKHYHKTLSAVLIGELAKDLTGHSMADVSKSLAAG
jgi:protein required for attachment to host cells